MEPTNAEVVDATHLLLADANRGGIDPDRRQDLLLAIHTLLRAQPLGVGDAAYDLAARALARANA
jgi:hypothetical protein